MVPLVEGGAGKEKQEGYRLTVRGIVQGVGFRPFVYQLACRWGLRGTVMNSPRGVIIEVEGDKSRLDEFYQALQETPPRLSVISSLEKEEISPQGFQGFEILASRGGGAREALVPPDVACCLDCQGEMLDPRDRHFRYPFTNCTNCGPRFTLIKDIPYDRDKTSMAGFSLCPACYRDYHDPSDRRFHAQPVACPRCGPRVSLVDGEGKAVPGDWLENIWSFLLGGKVVAVKSLGGFHLACQAGDRESLARLRKRKDRPYKPFAVMVRDLAAARKYCQTSPREEGLLVSPEAPIVILKRKGGMLPEGLAPGLGTLGVMLPYTPLHFLLFSGPLEVMVMTSANPRDLPICRDNPGALRELQGIADYFLLHDRDIINRCDDSLVAVVQDRVQFYRRSRGHVPRPLDLSDVFPPHPGIPGEVILGVGGEMKNAFCLLKGSRAIMSQYIGEMDSLETEEHFLSSLDHFKKFFMVEPGIIACDLHPGYQSSRMAREMEGEIQSGQSRAGAVEGPPGFPSGEGPGRPTAASTKSHFSGTRLIAVQHHHAHLASCLAENRLPGPVIGLILDGTGYGLDGRTWGFEILKGGYLDFTREWHLTYLPLPGGEKAVQQPWRMAVSCLYHFCGPRGRELARERFGSHGKELELVIKLLENNFPSPLASSCGRFFDAVSALLGICEINTYEGQAPVELEEMIYREGGAGAGGGGSPGETYPLELAGGEIKAGPVWRALVEDWEKGLGRAHIAKKFHQTIGGLLREGALRVRESSGLNQVALSGGAWHNRWLLTNTQKVLEEEGFQVFQHRELPPGDGGIALGQAVVAYARWKA